MNIYAKNPLLLQYSKRKKMNKKRILAVCAGNSCRSQMLEGYLRIFTGGRVDIYSAGVEAHGLNEYAVYVMQEDGADISRQTSNAIEEYSDMKFDLIISVCENAREQCAKLMNDTPLIFYRLADPADARGDKEAILSVYRSSRDDIRELCRTLTKKLNL